VVSLFGAHFYAARIFKNESELTAQQEPSIIKAPQTITTLLKAKQKPVRLS